MTGQGRLIVDNDIILPEDNIFCKKLSRFLALFMNDWIK